MATPDPKDPQKLVLTRPWHDFFARMMQGANTADDASVLAATIDESARGGEIQEAFAVGLMSLLTQQSVRDWKAEIEQLQIQLEATARTFQQQQDLSVFAYGDSVSAPSFTGLRLFPTTATPTIAGTGAVNNPNNAINGITTGPDYADLTATFVGPVEDGASLLMVGFLPLASGILPQSLALSITSQVISNTATAAVKLEYSINGAGFSPIYSVTNANRAKTTDIVALDVTQNPAMIFVRGGFDFIGIGDGNSAEQLIWDVHIEVR